MNLHNDQELQNTRRKLAGLQTLIRKKLESPAGSAASELSLESMRRRERKLLAEINEYERRHQTTR